ncbi:hypothetical protein IV203_025886 [Nitzschia inconspicua]|uniref:Uncharacterized protein n=1 Tax=Nitzschia inconspicua TaxID=303405 RepID=A0A9K3LI48_9STRA|nr:hypothetical protein IV203_025886 [Nitzschia inconspicua]
MNIDQETGEVINNGRSPRFTLWVAFFAFATITMGSAVSVKNAQENTNTNARWSVFCSAFSFAITGIVVLMHLSPLFSVYIIGTKLEGITTIILAAFWAATVSVVANASTGLAVDAAKDNTIVNGNLYYFSWAGFVTSILLVISYLRGVFGVDLAGEVKNRAARLTLWGGFLACQLVVMGSSANIFDKDCSNLDTTSAYCKRTKFGIALGAVGTFFALVVVAMKMLTSVAPFVVEGLLSLILCIMNGFGVAYLTSAQGPGSPIGNLYYFSWLSWFCSFMLLASVYEDYTNGGAVGATNENKEGQGGAGDVPVETIEDGL